MKKAIAIILSIMLVLVITLPAAAISSVNVKSIKLNISKVTLKVGQTSNLIVSLTPANTTQKKMTYVTGNKKIATVNTAGKITGVSKGTTTITVYTLNKKIFAKCIVTISQLAPVRKFVTVNVVMPGDISKRMSDFSQKELKDKMKNELNCELNFIYIPWGNYWDKLNIMFSAGQDADLFWEHASMANTHLSKKFIKPLNDSLNKEGKDLMKLISQKQWNSVTYDGQIMFIPMNEDSADCFHSVCVRQDILDEIGIKELKTYDDLLQYLTKGKEKHPDLDGIAGPLNTQLTKGVLSTKDITFIGKDQYAFVDESAADDKVLSYYESDEFKKYCEIARDLKQKGIMADWSLTKPGDALPKFNAGKLLEFRGTGGQTSGLNVPLLRTNTKNNNLNLEEYMINPNNLPLYFQTASGNQFAVPAQSKNPDRAVALINWINNSQKNFDFMVYGIKVTDYNLQGEKILPINKDELMPQWMLMNHKYLRYDTTIPQNAVDKMRHWSDGAQYSKTFSFNFNTDTIKSEVAKLDAVVLETINPILYGMVDFDKYYFNAVKQLKNAGLDAYIQELQKQFSEFRSKQK